MQNKSVITLMALKRFAGHPISLMYSLYQIHSMCSNRLTKGYNYAVVFKSLRMIWKKSPYYKKYKVQSRQTLQRRTKDDERRVEKITENKLNRKYQKGFNIWSISSIQHLAALLVGQSKNRKTLI